MKISSSNNYYYNQNKTTSYPSFKRNWAEHASWGANFIKEKGKADFKLFTYPDAKMVFVEIAKNAKSKFGNIKERLAQIAAATFGSGLILQNILPKDEETEIYPMENKGGGVFEAKGINTEENAQYRFIVAKNDSDIRLVKDPYSKKQPDINGWSEIYNPQNYKWQNTDWLEGKDSRRITRKPNEPMRGLEDLIIEEVNIPTLSKEGSFEKAIKYIDKIAQKGIATAVEFMPVENTYSLQWGYDGVDKFAVNEKMGNPEDFKKLIDYAHSKGLNVIIDMVPNHLGSDGDYLYETGPYEKGPGDWGSVPNFEGENNRYVRDWMVNAALWWANEFKADGLRLDMTRHCQSDWLLRQITDELNEHNPDVFIIAEDGRDNQGNVTTYHNYNVSHKDKLDMIDQCVDNITKKGWATSPYEIGFDSEWDFPLKDELKIAILNPNSINIDKLDSVIRNSHYRVKYLMSHDEIGNWDGTRLVPKVINEELRLSEKVSGIDDCEKGQKAAQLAQKLAELYLTENIFEMSLEELHKKAKEYGMDKAKRIHPAAIERAFNIAKAKHKLAIATTMTIPGPKMYFQGDDELDMAHFKFFREFSGDKYAREQDKDLSSKIIRNKGYDTLESIARPDSTIGRVKTRTAEYSNQTLSFIQDLSKLIKQNDTLRKGEIINTYKDNNHKVHTHHLKLGNEEVLVIKNFGGSFHTEKYGFVNFPQGDWTEVLNSDSKEYGGLDFINKDRIINTNNQGLNMAPNSIIILKKV